MKISRQNPKTTWFDIKINAETWQQLPDDATDDNVEEIRVCIKHLTSGELDSLQDRRIKTNVGRRGSTVESNFQYSEYAAAKRTLGVADWEGIIDEDTGEKLKVTATNMKILPGWLGQWILDKIDELSELGEDRLGE